MNLTCLKSGIWQVELRIPSDVRVVLGRTRFAKSTGTRDKRKASNKALPILTEWQQLRLRGHTYSRYEAFFILTRRRQALDFRYSSRPPVPAVVHQRIIHLIRKHRPYPRLALSILKYWRPQRCHWRTC